MTCEGMEPEVLTDYEGMEGTSVYTEESGMLTYEVDIAEEGMYEFGISYYPVAGNGSSIQRSFFVDGELSYRELSLIEFSRVWVNTSDIWDEDNQISVKFICDRGVSHEIVRHRNGSFPGFTIRTVM